MSVSFYSVCQPVFVSQVAVGCMVCVVTRSWPPTDQLAEPVGLKISSATTGLNCGLDLVLWDLS